MSYKIPSLFYLVLRSMISFLGFVVFLILLNMQQYDITADVHLVCSDNAGELELMEGTKMQRASNPAKRM